MKAKRQGKAKAGRGGKTSSSLPLPSKGNLTELQYNLVTAYIKNGGLAYKAAKTAGYSEGYAKVDVHNTLKLPAIQEKLQLAQRMSDDKLAKVFAWKIAKLTRIVDEYIPDDRSIPLNPIHVRVGISALMEMNKLHGDYAPEKRLAITVDATKERVAAAQRVYEDY